MLSEICSGYTKFNFQKKLIFYKHPNCFDIAKLKEKYLYFLNRAKSAEKKTNEELEKEFKENGLWGIEQEKKIKEKRNYLEGLKDNLEKAKTKQEEEIIEKNIKETDREISLLLNEKDKLFSDSLENYVEKKVKEYELFYLCFNDKNFKERYFETEEDFNCLNINEITEFKISVYSELRSLSAKKIELLILSNYFQPIFGSNTKESIPFYFSTKQEDRTYFQNIFTYYWQIYNGVIEADTPNYIREDPNKLIKYIKAKNNKEKRKMSPKDKDSQEMNINQVDFSKVKNANDL